MINWELDLGAEGDTYPREETDEEEGPLFPIQHHKKADGIGGTVHRRLEGGETREGIHPRGNFGGGKGFMSYGIAVRPHDHSTVNKIGVGHAVCV